MSHYIFAIPNGTTTVIPKQKQKVNNFFISYIVMEQQTVIVTLAIVVMTIVGSIIGLICSLAWTRHDQRQTVIKWMNTWLTRNLNMKKQPVSHSAKWRSTFSKLKASGAPGGVPLVVSQLFQQFKGGEIIHFPTNEAFTPHNKVREASL